jgi:hypothetical protein
MLNEKSSSIYHFFVISLFCFCPNEQLAQYYYDKGDFESKKSVMKNFKRDTLKNSASTFSGS